MRHWSGRAFSAALLVAGVSPAAAQPMIPTQADWDGARQSVTLPDGLRLAYVQLAAGNGTPLVLLHGYTDNSRSWSLLAPVLAEALPDRPIYAFDLRGHGASAVTDCCYGTDILAADVTALMDVLGIAQADLVGHSLGSITAAMVAGFDPARARRLVLISSALRLPPAASDWLWQTVPEMDFPLAPDSAFMQEWYWNPNPVDAEFLSREMAESASRPAVVWTGVLEGLSLTDWSSLTPSLTMPVLVMWGDQDGLFDIETQRELQTALPDARFETFAGYGHNMFWEAPDLAGAMIADFLTD